MEQKELLNIIQSYCRRLNFANFLKKLVFAWSIGAAVGIVFQVLAFMMPLYYVNVYMGIAILLAIVTSVIVFCIKHDNMRHTALVMDSFGFDERIITAYEKLNEGGMFPAIQRRDAMEHLIRHRDRIRIPLLPDRRKIALSLLLLTVMLVLAFIPSQMKERARELHRIHQAAREKEKEIEEVLDEIEKLEELEQETLTPEQLEALKEMAESLQASMNEYQQAASAESLQAADEKLNYKYNNMSSQMSDFAKSMREGATASPMSAESMQAMADKLKEKSGNPPSGGDSLASNQSQNDQNNGQNSQDGGQGNSRVDQNSQFGQDNEKNGQNDQDGQSGQSNGQNGQGSGQNGQGNSQNGQGNGQSGSGNGQGDQGSGQNGKGSNSGKARGTGSANYDHDYVSIPNDVADSENLTSDNVDHDNSDYFRAQNGLSWEGTHMPHEEVIGSYEKNAYEGIAAGKYPSGMENVIKEYFSSFNNVKN